MTAMVPVMSKQPYPSQTQDRFIVRLPDGLRDRIAVAAKANGRSMNSEIVGTLEKAYPIPEAETVLLTALEEIFERSRQCKTKPDAVDLYAAFDKYIKSTGGVDGLSTITERYRRKLQL